MGDRERNAPMPVPGQKFGVNGPRSKLGVVRSLPTCHGSTLLVDEQSYSHKRHERYGFVILNYVRSSTQYLYVQVYDDAGRNPRARNSSVCSFAQCPDHVLASRRRMIYSSHITGRHSSLPRDKEILQKRDLDRIDNLPSSQACYSRRIDPWLICRGPLPTDTRYRAPHPVHATS